MPGAPRTPRGVKMLPIVGSLAVSLAAVMACPPPADGGAARPGWGEDFPFFVGARVTRLGGGSDFPFFVRPFRARRHRRASFACRPAAACPCHARGGDGRRR